MAQGSSVTRSNSRVSTIQMKRRIDPRQRAGALMSQPTRSGSNPGSISSARCSTVACTLDRTAKCENSAVR
jgi:hypothetical protein